VHLAAEVRDTQIILEGLEFLELEIRAGLAELAMAAVVVEEQLHQDPPVLAQQVEPEAQGF
jgi:hypothetical protein